MVYGGTTVSAQVPRIARDKEGAQAFVQQLVMQTVFDVLERQGRSALLPDAVILAILNQLTVNITYEPLECVAVGSVSMIMVMNMERKCITASDTVTGICTVKANARRLGGYKMCSNPAMTDITPVANYTTISGTLTTTNTIMASWSRMMWQRVMDRAVRMLASGPFASQFFTATGTIN
ncbi:hypothetical protein KIN20_020093 [Parelaphostrongylus tenuis]|uniref:Uncharacterized protein n=1 Tax=Parelaphostrongylus tenuis TaxID=148309 RepID=A0AAD5QSZ2_PARTN|nr:hypothetical protein KIN20_020093 [Parelaphostrongylus tenuis]